MKHKMLTKQVIGTHVSYSYVNNVVAVHGRF